MMNNQLDNGDVIRRTREITEDQTKLFLDLLQDFLELSDVNISPDSKSLTRTKISDKINKILNK